MNFKPQLRKKLIAQNPFNSRICLCHFTLVTVLNNFCQLNLNYSGRNVRLNSDLNTESDMFYTPQNISLWEAHLCILIMDYYIHVA